MRTIAKWTLPFLLTACVTQSPQVKEVEPVVSSDDQQAAQQAVQTPTVLTIKRKIAVGQLSNETDYGKSTLSGSSDDKMAAKITDMLVHSLNNSGNYLVVDRPDISLLQSGSELNGSAVNIIGVDTLVIGSLTEFRHSTTGESDHLSSTKKQEAKAVIELRLVDIHTGQVTQSVSGSGSPSTETASAMGFGSLASYDGSLNDQAIGAAINSAVEKMTQLMLTKPWSANILSIKDDLVYFSGGESQGIKSGMRFAVVKKGQQIESSTTGLPGSKVAEIRVLGTFGQTELEQGTYGQIVSGSVKGLALVDLEVRELTE